MEEVVNRIIRRFFCSLRNDIHVEPSQLRIRIPPDRLVICSYCNAMYSLAHAEDCPGCKE